MSALKVTPPTQNLMDDPAYSTCIANLRAAGYVILSPDEVRGIRDEALEEAAERGDAWDNPSSLRLAAGEMTAQELRTARAVARGIAAAIRSLKGGRDAQ